LGTRLDHPRVLGCRREEFGEEDPPSPKTWREREGFEKKVMVRGLNTARLVLGQTLFWLIGHCLSQPDLSD
jgi:hypothetical protein